MKALVVTQNGGPEALQLQDVPGPQPGPQQVLVNVEACGVNFADILMVQGSYAGGPHPPFTAGREFAGRNLATGERVMGYAQEGAFAERVAIRRDFVWPIPVGWSAKSAAAFPVNYFTAFFAYWWAGLWQPGAPPRSQSKPEGARPRVLIHAAAGGVGTAAVQIGKLLKVEMFGTSSSDEKLDKVKELGLEHGINYRREDYEERIRALTKGEGVDAVFDMLGGDHTGKSTRCLKFQGCVVAYGSATGTPHKLDVRALYSKCASIKGLWLTQLSMRKEFMDPAWKQLSAWIAEGQLKPVVGHVLPLDKAGEAFRLMLERKNEGKIVLTI